ncbi:MAG: hypothetical protein GX621_11170, partial [Pirellulaceae bacterium]|nr:hypothetical protein [Pirellulaceae bacterium]
TMPPIPVELQGGFTTAVPFLTHDPWNSRESLLEGRFCFQRREESLGWPPEWNAPDLPLLWRYTLHYFSYLSLLSEAEQIAICTDWVENNPWGRTVGWYPYPTSLRIVNWCKAGLKTPRLLESLYHQAAYLYRNLELYNPGNHLLENARALIFAGYYLQSGEAHAWISRALRLLRREIPIQVLDDGGYFERSPMYHAIMLEGFLDILNILPLDHADRPLLLDAAMRMSDFLASTCHPDGNIALFNDATQETAPRPASILGYASRITGHRAMKRSTFAETGFFVYENSSVYLIIDGGPIGPDYLPAHAHADIFSYELSVGGQPFIVDTGVFQYAAGPMRELVRKTSAHNTVSVDEMDQVECWHSFQVGRRWPPRDVTFRESKEMAVFRGTYDGYAKLIGDEISHHRTITCHAQENTIEVADIVEGHGLHASESRIHLHPEVVVVQTENALVFWHGETWCRLEVCEGESSLGTGLYCPALGLQLRNQVVRINAKGPLPLRMHYRLTYSSTQEPRA